MLEDSSFSIHPEKQTNDLGEIFLDIGDAEQIDRDPHGLTLRTAAGEFKILIYRDEIIRFIFQPFGPASVKTTAAVIARPEPVPFDIREEEKRIILSTKKLILHINKEPVRVTIMDESHQVILQEGKMGIGTNSKKEAVCFKEMTDDDHFYGFGEKTGFLNKKGDKLIMWNTDVYAPHNPETDPLYQSIPFFLALNKGKAYGIYFDNSFKSCFDFQSEKDAYSFHAEGGQLDYYFLAGPGLKEVIERYSLLTGRMPLPPKWAIGYHQSRYSYETDNRVREIAGTFQKKEIPLDAIYLDIHYMDGYRVFTFDRSRFQNPKKLVEELKEKGIMTVPIVDPGVKEDPEYEVFQEGMVNNHFCKYIDGKVYYGDVWPGNSAFPDFANTGVRKWWGERHRFYTDLGIEGIWNDMNEPAVFNKSKTMDEKVVHDHDGVIKTHREMHNLYGFYMCEATYRGMKSLLNGKRPFLVTRAGFSGVQRYAAVWTGDNRSFWEHLQMSLPMIMNLGLSGVPFAGADVGGFAHHANGELLARWTQAGAFMPFFRNHSAIESCYQEPWSFGEKYEKVIKKYIELRYQWLPQLYTLFAEAHKRGIPVMRPLFLEYPEDVKTYNINDQFLVGENTLIAPIMHPSADHRAVYFPEGLWVDYWTDRVLAGNQYHLVSAPLDTLPIFIKKGTAVIHGEKKSSTAVPDKKMIFHLYYHDKSAVRFHLYDDDGRTFNYEKGDFLQKTFHVCYDGPEIIIQTTDTGQFKPAWTQMEFIIHCCNQESLQVELDGKKAAAVKKAGHVFSVVF